MVLVTIVSMSCKASPASATACTAKVEGVALVRLGALLPGVGPEVPLFRFHRVAPLDAGIGVEGIETGILRIDLVGALGDLFLPSHVLRYGGGDG